MGYNIQALMQIKKAATGLVYTLTLAMRLPPTLKVLIAHFCIGAKGEINTFKSSYI